MVDNQDYSVILGAIESMRKSHDECIMSLREEMSISQRASVVHLNSEMEVVNMHLKSLDEKVTKQNGSVAELQAESLKRADAVHDFRELEKDINAVKRTLRTKWMLLLLGGVLFVVCVIFIYEMGAFPKMFQWMIDKIF